MDRFNMSVVDVGMCIFTITAGKFENFEVIINYSLNYSVIRSML